MELSIASAAIGTVTGPLIGAVLAPWFSRAFAHRITITGVGLALVLSLWLLIQLQLGHPDVLVPGYTWGTIGDITIGVSFWLDALSVLMMVIVTAVSLMVHIYTIGYMEEDSGYKRFFSYIALFTFAMLMLVMSANFVQLFFGWEAVGVVSYLLIGFWFEKESAVFANLKAFLVNRVGDLGFLLGIGLVFSQFHSLDYATVFAAVPNVVAHHPSVTLWGNFSVAVMTAIPLCLLIGAMGKSAQIPLHIWLPDSMEGPTPISALIHAATMVTAGIFMIARMSPLFEHSAVVLNALLGIGISTCVLMGILGVVQNDIKRIIAYSTLSQLGLMMAGLGASLYAVSIFHLMTHAFFKALLFLGAGSVIMALHHEQDIRNMGGLARRLPLTYMTMWIGSLALMGFPFFSGFYSKDLLIEGIAQSDLYLAPLAAAGAMLSVLFTAWYSIRLLLKVFHGTYRGEAKVWEHSHETGWTIQLPLWLLAIPSVGIGYFMVQPILTGYLKNSIFIDPYHQALHSLGAHFEGPVSMGLHAFTSVPFMLVVLGSVCAFVQWRNPVWLRVFNGPLRGILWVLNHKYGFDALNEKVLIPLTHKVGNILYKVVDGLLIEGVVVHGVTLGVLRIAQKIRGFQSGYLYHYALVFLLGLLGVWGWMILRG